MDLDRILGRKNLHYFHTSSHKHFNMLARDTWMAKNFQGACHLHIINAYMVGFGNKVLDGEGNMIEV